jgi:hypothetical protein
MLATTPASRIVYDSRRVLCTLQRDDAHKPFYVELSDGAPVGSLYAIISEAVGEHVSALHLNHKSIHCDDAREIFTLIPFSQSTSGTPVVVRTFTGDIKFAEHNLDGLRQEIALAMRRLYDANKNIKRFEGEDYETGVILDSSPPHYPLILPGATFPLPIIAGRKRSLTVHLKPASVMAELPAELTVILGQPVRYEDMGVVLAQHDQGFEPTESIIDVYNRYASRALPFLFIKGVKMLDDWIYARNQLQSEIDTKMELAARLVDDIRQSHDGLAAARARHALHGD